VRKHIIKQVVTKVLEAEDVCWGDKEDEKKDHDDEDEETLAMTKKGGKEKDREKDRECKKSVPKRDYEEDCVVSGVVLKFLLRQAEATSCLPIGLL